MLSKEDIAFFKKYYPNTNFNDAYWSFVCFFDEKYADTMPESLKNIVIFGLSFKSGGGLMEMVMVWESLDRRPGPFLRTYMDAALMLACPMLNKIALIMAEKQNCLLTPAEFSKVLLSLGFEDNT